MVEFSEKSCFLCSGSRYVTPGPYYHKKKKCDHRWSKSSWEDRVREAREKMEKAKSKYDLMIKIDSERVL